jgi:hypothetical protein
MVPSVEVPFGTGQLSTAGMRLRQLDFVKNDLASIYYGLYKGFRGSSPKAGCRNDHHLNLNQRFLCSGIIEHSG